MAGKPTYEELEQRVRQLEQVEIDRQRTEEHIRFLSSAVEQSSEGMAIADTEGNLIYVNQAWVEMHGYESSEELTGQNFSIFHNPEQLINEVEPFNSIVMKNGYCKGEVWHIRKDGKPFPTLMTTTLLKDESGNPTAISGIAKDITDVKRAEEKLKSERDTLQGLMDGLATTRIGVDVVGVDYKIIQQSKLLIDTFGDLTGKLCYASYMGLDIPCDQCPMAAAIKSRKVERAEMLGSDGRHYEIFSAPLPSPDGGIDKAIEVVLDITERKQAEEALRESEEQYRTLFQTMTQGVVYQNAEGKIISANLSAEKILGLSIDQMQGKTSVDLRWKSIHEDGSDFAGETHPSMVALNTGQMVKDVIMGVFNPQTESYRWININATPQFKAGQDRPYRVYTTFEDITERKRDEEDLRKSEEKYRELVENANSIILRMDKDGKIIFFNKFAQDFFAYSEEEIIGKNAMGTIIPETENTGRNLRDMFLDIKRNPQKYLQNENENIKKNGERVQVSWTNKATQDENGNVVEILSIGNDITDKKAIEKQLQHIQRMESIGNLAGGIAHDFNNILSSIIGFTELALGEVEKGSSLEDSLQEVYTAGKRARDLVKQILAFARQSDEERKPIKVYTIVKEVMKLMRSTIPASIEIKENIESNSLIMGNPSQVHQLFMNLCTNAAQAMEDSGGILEVSLKDVMLDNGSSLTQFDLEPGNYVKVTVSDTGPGIAPDIISSIFDPYFTTKVVGEGTGMGLSMVHGIVEAYGGKITVESELGTGAVFSIYLPITRKLEDQRSYEKEKLPTGTERILFIDDELPIAKMGSQILERLGYQVAIRTSSVEALELFRSKPDDFDLVITDMTMPNMTGDKLAMELIAFRSDIPVILCTGYSKKITEEKAVNIGIKAFAYKPIVKADLAKTVRKVLDEVKDSTR